MVFKLSVLAEAEQLLAEISKEKLDIPNVRATFVTDNAHPTASKEISAHTHTHTHTHSHIFVKVWYFR
jgi:hypothetical protein